MTCISGLCSGKESIRQEGGGLPEPAEGESYLITPPESNTLEEHVGKRPALFNWLSIYIYIFSFFMELKLFNLLKLGVSCK